MANLSEWKKIINGKNKTYDVTVDSLDEMRDFFRSHGMISVTSKNGAYHSPIYVKVTNAANNNSASIVSNVRVHGSNGVNGARIQAEECMVETVDGHLQKTGAVFSKGVWIIAAVAGASGYSIGWDIAQQIYLDIKDKIDWGMSVTPTADGEGKQVFTLGSVINSEVINYVEDKLIEKIVNALDEWGLFDAHEPLQPLNPTYNTSVNYDFSGRFPAVPSKYIKDFQKIIDKVNEPTLFYNNYINCCIRTNGTVILDVTVPYQHRLNIRNRSSELNTGDIISDTAAKEIIYFNHQYEDNTSWRFNLDENGNLVRERYDWPDGDLRYRLSASDTYSYYIYDNFGLSYYTITEDGKIGGKVVDLTGIHLDPDVVDIRHGIEHSMATWWNNRIKVSYPDTKQWSADYVMPSYLNDYEWYLPLTIPGKDIDSTATQAKAVTGKTSDDIMEKLLKDTDAEDLESIIGLTDGILDYDVPKDTPPIPTLPAGIGADGFVSMYKLNSTELSKFAHYLWSPNFFDNLIKMFNDPMEAVIGCHAVYHNPTSVDTGHIWVGNIKIPNTSEDEHDGIDANYLNQYSSLDCGYVYLKPFYKNVNDYTNTEVQLYLPFIGFVELNVEEVMGKYIGVSYNIDNLTGACIAFISLKDSLDDNPFVAYQFGGNCCVEIPISSSNYVEVIKTAISAVSGVNSVAASSAGYARKIMAAHTIGAGIEQIGNTLTHSMIPVQRAGQIVANVGAMGIKKPYLIVRRKYAYDATNRNHFEGLPQNANVKLSTQNGYTRVKYINLEGLSASEMEKDIILAKLQGGVFI